MRIVHLGSKLISTFGVLHDSDDVTDATEFSFPLPSLSHNAFAALLPHCEAKRRLMEQQAVTAYRNPEEEAHRRLMEHFAAMARQAAEEVSAQGNPVIQS